MIFKLSIMKRELYFGIRARLHSKYKMSEIMSIFLKIEKKKNILSNMLIIIEINLH